MAKKNGGRKDQFTFTHLIITALVTLVIGYLFGRFSLGLLGEPGTSGSAQGPQVASQSATGGFDFDRLQEAVEDSPDSAIAWTTLGNAYFDSGRFTEAVDAYTRSLQIDPSNPDVQTDRGIMYRRLGNPMAAIRDFEAAAALDPAHINSRLNIGIVYSNELNDSAQALVAFEDVLKIDPDYKTPTGVPLRDFMETLRE